MKVLIVDDEILVRKGLSMGIDWQALGFDEVKEASNGVEALEYAKVAYPHLVFTDIKMPKMDGLMLIDELKKYCPETVIIVLSCINDSAYIREAMKFNRALDYIPKLSMGTDELIEVVKNAKQYIKEPLNKDEINKVKGPSINLFNKEMEIALKQAVDSEDLSQINQVVKVCFEKAEALSYGVEQFIDWHEIYAVLSSLIKSYQGNMNLIQMGSQNAYDYLSQSKSLEQMKSRFETVIEVYLIELKVLKGKVFNKVIHEAVTYIHKNYRENVKLSDVAKYVGMNESYLSRLFKKNLNINFVDYLNQIRIQQAKELLNNPELLISDIAYQVGYSNENYFSRVFKAVEGISPRQYQKK